MSETVKMEVSKPERILIVAALTAYMEKHVSLEQCDQIYELAVRLAAQDPADDGPEVGLLRAVYGFKTS